MEITVAEAHREFPVNEQSQVGFLRRAVREQAFKAGFSQEHSGRAEIVATELATNLIKHTHHGGHILLRGMESPDNAGLELISLDTGPGLSLKQDLIEDGISTVGTLGIGLGAIKRLSDEFELRSDTTAGTVVLSRFWKSHIKCSSRTQCFDIGGVMVPKPGERACGDGWAVHQQGACLCVLVVDGLGHGVAAKEAAEAAIDEFKRHNSDSLSKIMLRIHASLQHTRGAVLSIASIDRRNNTVKFAGIGNIAGRITNPSASIGCVSLEGTVGLRVGRVCEFTYPWETDSILYMNSDGLTSQARLPSWRDLTGAGATVVAARLYRDFARRTDDATVVVIRNAAVSQEK